MVTVREHTVGVALVGADQAELVRHTAQVGEGEEDSELIGNIGPWGRSWLNIKAFPRDAPQFDGVEHRSNDRVVGVDVVGREHVGDVDALDSGMEKTISVLGRRFVRVVDGRCFGLKGDAGKGRTHCTGGRADWITPDYAGLNRMWQGPTDRTGGRARQGRDRYVMVGDIATG